LKAKEYTKTLSILLELINRFYNGEYISTDDISKQYGVSKRTAQRYINYLKKAGFNIQKQKKRYFLGFFLDNEKELLFQTIKSLAKNAGIDKELLPLLKELKLINQNIIFSKLDIENINPQTFTLIEKAIYEKKELIITYNNSQKNIKPLKISNFEGFWYLHAFNSDNKYRTYHIKSIKSLKLTNKKFEIDDNFLNNLDKAINIWFDPYTKPIQVELFADGFVTKYLQRIPISKTQHLIKHKDGSSTIYLEITHENEILMHILKWLPHIKVISPKSLNEKIKEIIKNY